nr:nucleotidyltransferase family protein [Cytobacillus eiseniae]
MAVNHMLAQKEILELLSNNLNTWKEKYGIEWIALFGSYTRGEQKESSDIDLLVEFAEHSMTFDNYIELKFELEDLFHKPIDLVMIEDIKPAIKPSILRSAKYAEGA